MFTRSFVIYLLHEILIRDLGYFFGNDVLGNLPQCLKLLDVSSSLYFTTSIYNSSESWPSG